MTRETKPRDYIERPKENYKNLDLENMNSLLRQIDELSNEDLAIVMSRVTKGLITQRDSAVYRAVDFETAVGNIAMRPAVTRKTWEFITEEFIKPHQSAIRNPSLIDWLGKRIRDPRSTVTIEDGK